MIRGGVVLRIDIVTIFPEYFEPLGISLIGKAARRGDISVTVHDLRAWASDVHRTVDDTPFGGGPGMVMTPEPWGAALDAITGVVRAPGDPGNPVPGNDALAGPGARLETSTDSGPQLILPTPAGEVFDQAMATELARASHLVFACGRYEGIDGRVAEYARSRMLVREVSIGDYVLAGGEPAVLVMIEAIGRLLPGVLGNTESAPDDSFGAGAGPMRGLVAGPAYTRPRNWRGLGVPDVLLSGNHAAIARWRRDEALRHTARTRPDLIAGIARDSLDAHDRQVLSEAGFAVSSDDVAH